MHLKFFPKSSIDKLNYTINHSNRVEIIDNLRGLSVVFVVLKHFNILNLQGIAVDLFFLVSGMLVSKGLIKSYINNEPISFRSFFIKRATKILPSYYFLILTVTILAYFIIKPIAPFSFIHPLGLPQYIFFYKNFKSIPGHYYFDHLWSLSVEEHFYILLPLIFLIVQRYYSRNIKLLLAAIILLIALGIIFKTQSAFTQIAAYPSYTQNRIDCFAWGILISLMLSQKNTFIHRLLNRRLLAIVGLCIIVFPLYFQHPIDTNNMLLRIMAPAGWFFIIIGLYNITLPALKPLRYVAYFGFNIYLWHYVLIIPINYYIGSGWLGLTIYLISSGILGVLATFYVEDLFLKFREPLMKYFLKNEHKNKSESILQLN